MGVTKSQTQLSNEHTHTQDVICSSFYKYCQMVLQSGCVNLYTMSCNTTLWLVPSGIEL